MHVYVCVFEDSKLLFHKHSVVLKKLKKYKSDIKESGIELYVYVYVYVYAYLKIVNYHSFTIIP